MSNINSRIPDSVRKLDIQLRTTGADVKTQSTSKQEAKGDGYNAANSGFNKYKSFGGVGSARFANQASDVMRSAPLAERAAKLILSGKLSREDRGAFMALALETVYAQKKAELGFSEKAANVDKKS